MRSGRVKSVDYVSDKEGEDVWAVITDARNIGADSKNRNGIYLAHDGPKPPVGTIISWSARSAHWDGGKAKKVSFEFWSADPSLFTG